MSTATYSGIEDYNPVTFQSTQCADKHVNEAFSTTYAVLFYSIGLRFLYRLGNNIYYISAITGVKFSLKLMKYSNI